MVKAVMDFCTIIEGADAFKALDRMVEERVVIPEGATEEEEDALIFSIFEDLDASGDKFAGEIFTAARFKSIVHEAVLRRR